MDKHTAEAGGHTETLAKAAEAIRNADVLLICAGAGIASPQSMSADSGLPVYKDVASMPLYQSKNLEYMHLSQPRTLETDKDLFYEFWNQCYLNYTNATPHTGYNILLDWRNKITQRPENPGSCFVYTSNVDKLFEKVGFPKQEIHELHGNALTLQCATPCCSDIYPYEPETGAPVTLDYQPVCPKCNGPARPNVLMFGDRTYVRPKNAHKGYAEFRKHTMQLLKSNPNLKLVIVEIGCGKLVPALRNEAEEYLHNCGPQATLIRINRDYIELDTAFADELPPDARGTFVGIQGAAAWALAHINANIGMSN